MLENKVAIVTGAAQGIGAGIAREFASNGAGVVIFDRDEAQGDRPGSGANRDMRHEGLVLRSGRFRSGRGPVGSGFGLETIWDDRDSRQQCGNLSQETLGRDDPRRLG